MDWSTNTFGVAILKTQVFGFYFIHKQFSIDNKQSVMFVGCMGAWKAKWKEKNQKKTLANIIQLQLYRPYSEAPIACSSISWRDLVYVLGETPALGFFDFLRDLEGS